MLRAINLLQSLLMLNLLLYWTIYIEATPQRDFVINTYATPLYSALGEPTLLINIPTLFTKRHRWLNTRIRYYSNTSASYNITTTAILVCGDVHPNPGPTPIKQSGTKLNCLRTLYLNARSLKAVVESTDDGGKRIPKLNIFQNLVYLEQYDIICVCETWLNHLILDNEILPGYTIYRKDRHDNARGGGVLIAVKNEIRSSRRASFEGAQN